MAKVKESPSPLRKKPATLKKNEWHPVTDQKTRPQQPAASPSPSKKSGASKKDQRPPVAEEEKHRKIKPQQPVAYPSPSTLKKKSALNSNGNSNKKRPPPVISSSAAHVAATDDDSTSDEAASDSPPEAKPVYSSKPDELPSAAASPKMRVEKKRKRKQHQDGGSAQEGEGDATAAGNPSSKKPFQRVWTVEDEIALLRCMLDSQVKDRGAHSAVSDISMAVGGKFSKIQISGKLGNLRRKYERKLRRREEGADPSFSEPHEQVVFDLSRKVWPTVKGDVHGYKGGDKRVGTKGKSEKMGCERAELLYPVLAKALNMLVVDGDNLSTRSVSKILASLKRTKAKALEDRWNKHFVAGTKYCLDRARMKKELLVCLAKVLNG